MSSTRYEVGARTVFKLSELPLALGLLEQYANIYTDETDVDFLNFL
jgi:hypothetical protein